MTKNRLALWMGLAIMLVLTACIAGSRNPTQSPDEPVQNAPGQQPENPSNGGEPAAWVPQPGDANLQRAEAQVQTQQVLTKESYPPQFSLVVEGTVPTPCHQARIEVPEPSADNRIDVSVYSVVDPNAICAQVLEPFTASVPLENLEPGKYTILVNGDQAGEIVVP
jgi:hypothetical protein